MHPATRSNFIIDDSEDLPLSVSALDGHPAPSPSWDPKQPPAGPSDRGPHGSRSVSEMKPPTRVAALEIHEALLAPSLLDPAAGELEFVHPIPLWKRRWMVIIFSLTASLLFADQNLLAPNLSMAADFFGFDDNERDAKLGGFIMAAFFITGAPAALLVGWLTDKVNRRNLLFFVVILGEAPCLATYWVTEYWQFFLLRTLTGISVGGCFPLIYSLLGDLFPISKRNVVSASVALSTGAGVAVGQALAGYIGPATNDWRVPFMVVAAPALVISVVMVLTCPEPPRGAFEEALKEQYATGVQYTETITWAKVRILLRIPCNILIITQGMFGSLPWGMLLTFLNDYLATDPPSGQGLGVHVATLILLTFGLGGAIGVVCGGLGGQYLYNRKKEYLPMMMFCSVMSGTAPMYYLVNAPLTRLPLALTICVVFFSGCCAGIAGPNLRAVILNVNEPETRGVALALQSMTDDVGKGLGPVFVAIFIQALGRRQAFNLAVAGWYPCAVMLGALYWHIRRDEERMQERLQLHACAPAPPPAPTELGCIDHGSLKAQHHRQDDEPGGGDGAGQRRDSVRLLRVNDSHVGGSGQQRSDSVRLLSVNDSHIGGEDVHVSPGLMSQAAAGRRSRSSDEDHSGSDYVADRQPSAGGNDWVQDGVPGRSSSGVVWPAHAAMSGSLQPDSSVSSLRSGSLRSGSLHDAEVGSAGGSRQGPHLSAPEPHQEGRDASGVSRARQHACPSRSCALRTTLLDNED